MIDRRLAVTVFFMARMTEVSAPADAYSYPGSWLSRASAPFSRDVKIKTSWLNRGCD